MLLPPATSAPRFCTSSADRGGNAGGRLLGAEGHSRIGRAVAADLASGVLCATLSECPRSNLAGALVARHAEPDLPPGVKSCQYRESLNAPPRRHQE